MDKWLYSLKDSGYSVSSSKLKEANNMFNIQIRRIQFRIDYVIKN